MFKWLTTPLNLPVTDSLLSVFKYSILWKDTSTNYKQVICKYLYKEILLCNSSWNHLASFPTLPAQFFCTEKYILSQKYHLG